MGRPTACNLPWLNDDASIADAVVAGAAGKDLLSYGIDASFVRDA